MAPPKPGRVRDEEMVDPRMEHVKRIQQSVARDEYRVDASAVADAILRRLLDGRSITQK